MGQQVYFDNNTIQRAEEAWSSEEFRHFLTRHHVHPTIGTHTIYELARGFTDNRRTRRVQKVCKFLASIDELECLEQTQELLRGELDHARTGMEIVNKNILTGLNRTAWREAVTKLSLDYADEAISFVKAREGKISTEHPVLAKAVIRGFRQASKNHLQKRSLRSELHDFKQFRQHVAPSLSTLLASGL